MIRKITNLVNFLICIVLVSVLVLLWLGINITSLKEDTRELNESLINLQLQVKTIQIVLDEHIEAPNRVECPD